jgi:hypothetical protein
MGRSYEALTVWSLTHRLTQMLVSVMLVAPAARPLQIRMIIDDRTYPGVQ